MFPARTLLLCLPGLLLVPGCKEPRPSPRGPEITAYLMPPGRDRVELQMERRVSGPGRETTRQARRVLAIRSKGGVIYRISERVEKERWRTAATLRFEVDDRGAYITRQEDLTGQPVGVRERRLVFPWPLRAGGVRSLVYKMLGPQEDGGRRAKATVTVTRQGFGEVVDGKTHAPCFEVREVLEPDVGGRLDIRSVYCRGLGRVRIEQRNETLSRGELLVVDQLLSVRDAGK